jgi:hypothetical protein
MDALVKAALDSVNESLMKINWNEIEKKQHPSKQPFVYMDQSERIKAAVHSVDALKSALKRL